MKSARWLVHPSSLKTETARRTITNPPQKNEFCNYYYRLQTPNCRNICAEFAKLPVKVLSYDPVDCFTVQKMANSCSRSSCKFLKICVKFKESQPYLEREEWISSYKTKSFSHRYFLQVAISFIHLYFIIAVYFQKKFKGKGIEKTFWCNFELVFYK